MPCYHISESSTHQLVDDFGPFSWLQPDTLYLVLDKPKSVSEARRNKTKNDYHTGILTISLCSGLLKVVFLNNVERALFLILILCQIIIHKNSEISFLNMVFLSLLNFFISKI